MRKQTMTKPQTRQIAKGITLVGYASVEKWDEQIRAQVSEKEAKQEASYTKEVTWTPDFSLS